MDTSLIQSNRDIGREKQQEQQRHDDILSTHKEAVRGGLQLFAAHERLLSSSIPHTPSKRPTAQQRKQQQVTPTAGPLVFPQRQHTQSQQQQLQQSLTSQKQQQQGSQPQYHLQAPQQHQQQQRAPALSTPVNRVRGDDLLEELKDLIVSYETQQRTLSLPYHCMVVAGVPKTLKAMKIFKNHITGGRPPAPRDVALEALERITPANQTKLVALAQEYGQDDGVNGTKNARPEYRPSAVGRSEDWLISVAAPTSLNGRGMSIGIGDSLGSAKFTSDTG
ncbi:hypothetical protein HDU90_006352 [Geranomyces variabilis]|nr:hypothetical protein HDU90_006352 [Geranomyces variabilis]